MTPPTHSGLPITLGVTGHRDLRPQDLVQLTQQVRRTLSELRSKFPSSPFRLLSGLAEGADRLVAEVALDLGFELVAVLPVPVADYEKDFSGLSLETFQRLLSRAKLVVELPVSAQPDHRYLQLARYLAEHTHLLVALWNGKNHHEPGGTAQCVEFKLNGVPAEFGGKHSPLETPDFGTVFHLFAARVSHDPETLQPGQREIACYCPDEGQDYSVLLPQSWSQDKEERLGDVFMQGLSSLDHFNRLSAASLDQAALKLTKSYLLDEKTAETLNAGTKSVLHWAAVADVLAQRLQKRVVKTLILLFVMAASAFSLLSLFVELAPFTGTLALALGLLAFGLLVTLIANRRGWDNDYVDCRALAEGLRVQLYWRIAGVGEHVGDHYLQKYRGSMAWILMALRAVDLEAENEALSGVTKEGLEIATKAWVADQEKYFGRTSETREKQQSRQRLRTGTLFVLSLAALVGVVGLQIFQVLENPELDWQNLSEIKEKLAFPWLMFAFDTLLGIGTALATFAEVTGKEEEERQYRRMARLFGLGKKKILAAGTNGATVEGLLFALGKEALAENGDWLANKKANPIEMPLG